MNQGAKKIIKIVAISLFFLAIVFYGFFRSQDLIFGVKIKNVNIVDGATSTESVIKITGNAKHAVLLSIDNREISIDQNGDFSEDLALLPGYNIITIVAKDKFGHIDQKDYKLIFAPN